MSCAALPSRNCHRRLAKQVVDVLGERLPRGRVVELEGDDASHIQSMDAFLEAFEKHLATRESQKKTVQQYQRRTAARRAVCDWGDPRPARVWRQEWSIRPLSATSRARGRHVAVISPVAR